MSTTIGSALLETADKLKQINWLISESKFVDARVELGKLGSIIEQNPGSVVAGEYYYLQALVDFNDKPPLEVLGLAQKAYAIVCATTENLLIGRVQALLGKVHVALGDLKAGEDFIRDAISSFRRIDCDSELVGCLNKLAQVYFIRGEFRLADKFLTQSVELLAKEEAPSEMQLFKAKGNQARIKILLGQWNEAQKALEDCVSYSRRIGASPSEAKNLLSLGYVHCLKEEYAESRRLLDMAQAIIKTLDLVRERAIYHEYMGDLLRAMGDYNMARQHFAYALEIGERTAPRSAVVSQAERRLAELEYECGNYAAASEHAGRALEVAEHIGEIIETAAANVVLAALEVISGDEEKAVKWFDEAIACFESTGELRELANACYFAGKSLIKAKSKLSEPIRYLRSASQLAEQMQLPHLVVQCHYQLSLSCLGSNRYDEALSELEVCEVLAAAHDDDRVLEACRMLRLSIEDEMVDAGLSNDNQYSLFSSFLTAAEYGHLKSGTLEETLCTLKKKVAADRAFILSFEPTRHAFEALANVEFDRSEMSRISRSLSNGRAGSLPLDRPLLITSMNGDRGRMFDYLLSSAGPIRALMVIPMQLSKETGGIIYLDRIGESAKPFSKSNLDFAIAFSDILALKSSEEQTRRLAVDNQRLKDQLQKQSAFPNFITNNPTVLAILDRVIQVKDSPISILIEGETGTGKDLLAKAIHYNSNRRERRFITVNCAALPETLLESELFGHKRGAFTGAESEKSGLFEEADGGTFFLDEIGDMPLSIQVKLLRVIEEKEIVRLGDTVPRKVDVRVISATNRDLKACMQQGQFRQDLYYRLSTFTFRLPPLRERREDLPLLIKHFVAKTDPAVKIEPEAFNLLVDYDWPGNVRELENEIKKLALLSGDRKVISLYLISRRISEAKNASPSQATTPAGSFSLYDHLARLEREYILNALRKTRWVKKYAAESLAIPESTLRLKIKQYRITPE
jgi:transcriptional regulator with GAF, ATPase, and Fis domain